MGTRSKGRNPIRIYADTSVFGGAFDNQFRADSTSLFEQVRQGYFTLVISAIVKREVSVAPARVRELFEAILPLAEIADPDMGAIRLAEAYVQAGILTPKSADDAMHVALATISDCSVIVSWNFRHIVHFEKMPLYNAVNTVSGYRTIAICSPSEVIKYADENQEEI